MPQRDVSTHRSASPVLHLLSRALRPLLGHCQQQRSSFFSPRLPKHENPIHFFFAKRRRNRIVFFCTRFIAGVFSPHCCKTFYSERFPLKATPGIFCCNNVNTMIFSLCVGTTVTVNSTLSPSDPFYPSLLQLQKAFGASLNQLRITGCSADPYTCRFLSYKFPGGDALRIPFPFASFLLAMLSIFLIL